MFAKLISPGVEGGEQYPAYPCYYVGDVPGHGNCYEGGIPLDGKCVGRGIIPRY